MAKGGSGAGVPAGPLAPLKTNPVQVPRTVTGKPLPGVPVGR